MPRFVGIQRDQKQTCREFKGQGKKKIFDDMSIKNEMDRSSPKGAIVNLKIPIFMRLEQYGYNQFIISDQ